LGGDSWVVFVDTASSALRFFAGVSVRVDLRGGISYDDCVCCEGVILCVAGGVERSGSGTGGVSNRGANRQRKE